MVSPKKNKTWELVDLPKGKKLVGCRWEFTIKYKANGTLEKYMAWLLAKGYTQSYGIVYLKTFLPIAKMKVVRILLSLAANYGQNLKQFDVTNFFMAILKRMFTWSSHLSLKSRWVRCVI